LLVIVAILSIVVGQRSSGTKSRYRPDASLFAAMERNADQSASYFEQNDQPSFDGQFQELYVNQEDFEPENTEGAQYGGNKFVRHPTHDPSVFQSLCPTRRTSVVLDKDPYYEYRPASYEEVRCECLRYS
jgi:hypothetical protein